MRHKKITRREFLIAGGAASVALLASSIALSSCEEHLAKRVAALVDQMTLDEKIQMVHGRQPSDATGYIPPISRLDIPELQLTDGPLGIRSQGAATAFPAAIAMAATWDPNLARDQGVALGTEAKAKGQDVLLAPGLNIDRVPLNGRTFEYYSEDPYLTSLMAVETIKGIQSVGTIATAKHYVANNQEADRMTVSANVSERALREIYLPGFEAAVREGKVGSVMAAFNKVNGVYCTENEQLLMDILKNEWGFEGYVVSDFGATISTVTAAEAGLDLEMPTGEYFGDDLRQAYQNGEVSMTTLNDKVSRVLRQMALSGALDRRNEELGEENFPRHQVLAREIAANGTVLLKYQGSTLPLDQKEINSIAVIGPGADTAQVGGGGSSAVEPPYSISLLEGIEVRAGSGISVKYASGEELRPVPSSVLTPPDATNGESGLEGEYFNNRDFSGQPNLMRIDEQVNFNSVHGWPPSKVDRGNFSVRWTGTLTAQTAGTYIVALTSDGGSYLYMDDKLVVDNGGSHGVQTRSHTVEFEAGRPHFIRIDYVYSDSKVTASIAFDWRTPEQDPVGQAAELARRSDVAIVVATEYSREGADRSDLELPGDQNKLISAVANANERTVVVLRTGGPVLMPWIEEVPNVLETWYPGMEEGNAIASVLFGDVNPSGKLPMTFGKRLQDYPANTKEQYPGVNGVADYSEGIFVGYRYFDEYDIEPLFGFGHGLSYASFAYDNLRVRPKQASLRETNLGNSLTHSSGLHIDLDVEIRNISSREGAEVVQLYLGVPRTEVPMPPKQLKGFQKVFLEPDQTKSVSFRLDERALSYWSTGANDWIVQSGTHHVMVGGSLHGIRLEDSFDVRR